LHHGGVALRKSVRWVLRGVILLAVGIKLKSGKIMKKSLASYVLCFVAALSGTAAQAATVLLNFDDLPFRLEFQDNIEYQGFVFSPSCHVDTPSGASANPDVRSWTSGWIATDLGGCSTPAGENPNYIGPTPAFGAGLYMARLDGGSFTLESLLPVAGSRLGVVSSNGGSRALGNLDISSPSGWAFQTFSGPQWTNVQWLMFQATGGTPQGFDDLTVSFVSEPPIQMAFVLALLAAGVSMRRRQQRPTL
jgi:hypothetical protein